MTDDILWHRIQFTFTITYHYLFPQLTMGLALLIVVVKVMALRTGDERYNEVAASGRASSVSTSSWGWLTGHPSRISAPELHTITQAAATEVITIDEAKPE